MSSHEKLTAIATEARNLFEKSQIPRGKLRELYLEYNHIENINDFLDQAQAMFPVLNCGLASVYLRNIVGDGEVMRGNYKGEGHTFLLLDSVVIDITADQFDGPPVYVGPLVLPWEGIL